MEGGRERKLIIYYNAFVSIVLSLVVVATNQLTGKAHLRMRVGHVTRTSPSWAGPLGLPPPSADGLAHSGSTSTQNHGENWRLQVKYSKINFNIGNHNIKNFYFYVLLYTTYLVHFLE